MKKPNIRNRSAVLSFDGLRSDEFDIIPFFEGHEKIRDILAFNNFATIELAKSLPLGLRGDAHRQMRARLARALVDGKKRLLPRLPKLIEEHFSILKKAGAHDILNEACKPFVDSCMALLSGIDLEAGQSERLSDIFDPGASIPRRRKLEELARDLVSHDKNGNLKISLAISAMGRDPLLGTLVYSLRRHFLSVEREPLNSLRFDPVPTDTAVPYVWREELSDEATSSYFECRLDQFVGQDAGERMKFFGAGRHTCLGKPHTLIIFEKLSEFISECDKVMLRSYVSSVNRHVMNLPDKFTAELG